MSDIKLSDKEIAALISEPKVFPVDYDRLFEAKERKNHKEREFTIHRADESQFKVIFRQSVLNPLDFSLILGYVPVNSSGLFRLRRYNGKSHEHTNPIEKQKFYNFHIHQATERYQIAGHREDKYAEPSNEYADIHGALECFMRDCFVELEGPQQEKIAFN